MAIPWEEHILNLLIAELRAELPAMLDRFDAPGIAESAIRSFSGGTTAVDAVTLEMAGGDDGSATQYARDADFVYDVTILRFNPDLDLAHRYAARTRAAIQQVLWQNRALDTVVKRLTWKPWIMVPGRQGEKGLLGVQLIWGIGGQKKVALSSFAAE